MACLLNAAGTSGPSQVVAASEHIQCFRHELTIAQLTIRHSRVLVLDVQVEESGHVITKYSMYYTKVTVFLVTTSSLNMYHIQLYPNFFLQIVPGRIDFMT